MERRELSPTSEIVDFLTPENRARHAQLRIVDSIAWAHDQLLPKLVIRRKLKSAVLHPSCSAIHLKLVPKMAALVTAIADETVVPAAHGCCAFAGDRGFLHPELTKSATADEAEEVRSRDFDAYLGSNRTCEIGMSLATGKDYESFIYALEELTGPVQPSAPP
jgi:D-lactate dehydrogenase